MKFKPTIADYQTLLDRFFPEATKMLGTKATTKTGKLSMLGKGYLLGSNQLEITDGVPELVTRFSGFPRETVDYAAQAVRHSRDTAMGRNGLKNAIHLERAKEALAQFGNQPEAPKVEPTGVTLSTAEDEVTAFIEMGIESGMTADQIGSLAADNGVYVDPAEYDRVLDERRVIIVPAGPVGVAPSKQREGETLIEFRNRCHREMLEEEPEFAREQIEIARHGFTWDYSLGTLVHKHPEVTEEQKAAWADRFGDDEEEEVLDEDGDDGTSIYDDEEEEEEEESELNFWED